MESILTWLSDSTGIFSLLNSTLSSSTSEGLGILNFAVHELGSRAFNLSVLCTEKVFHGNFTCALSNLSAELNSVIDYLTPHSLESRLLCELSLILCGNCLLVLCAWKVYGPRIAAKFSRTGASKKLIEELQTSMSELKLPPEHDFKYK